MSPTLLGNFVEILRDATTETVAFEQGRLIAGQKNYFGMGEQSAVDYVSTDQELQRSFWGATTDYEDEVLLKKYYVNLRMM
ncbi:hypothetical protein ACH42_06850 [Endozoicomonas sp. (ex Bugula neritina AB1)]|nr:hypothetical protein ACH42_06850 [Endozoicomonas sp. (ex Bugula neritina AB1)]